MCCNDFRMAMERFLKLFYQLAAAIFIVHSPNQSLEVILPSVEIFMCQCGV